MEKKKEKVIRRKNFKAIEDGIIRHIKNLFEQEEKSCYKPVRVGNFIATILLYINVMTIAIKIYQSKIILMKLNQT